MVTGINRYSLLLVGDDPSALSAAYSDADRNQNNEASQEHPVLDVNAKEAEAFDEDLHGRFPFWNLMIDIPKKILFLYF
jgi:hypothetical protein